jgi:hypothetical protein
MPGRGRGKAQAPAIQSGTNITVDIRESDTASLATFMESHPHLKLGDDTIGIFNEITPAKLRGKSININTKRRLLKWEPLSEADTVGYLTFVEDGVEKRVKAFQKKMALLDPIAWIRTRRGQGRPFSGICRKRILLLQKIKAMWIASRVTWQANFVQL